MTLIGRTLEVLGILLLLYAGYFLFAALMPTEAWDFFGRVYLPASGILSAAGACSLLSGIHLVRQQRARLRLNEEMARKSRSLRGVLYDSAGSSIPRATIDVFAKEAKGNRHLMALRTDATGRFSADLPAGHYVLEIGVPEIGESAHEIDVSDSSSPELEIRLDAVH